MEINFTKIQKIITSNLSETNNYGRSIFTILGLASIVGSIIIALNVRQFQGTILTIFMSIGAIMLTLGNNWLIKKRDLIFRTILSENKYFQKKLKNIDEIDLILEKVDHMNSLLKTMKINLYFTDIFYSDAIHHEQVSIFKKEMLLLLNYLRNLQSDLILRLNEQQQSLESVKSEVDKNIQGTTELEQVSELQKMRLDKQIEQFEELQRVLVKA